MKTALIFAAGRGERLKPLTDTCPKALCRIQGIPLIEYHVKHLSLAGFQTIIINHAYLGDMIRSHLGNGTRWNVNIHYSPEPPGALETGGALFNARQLIGNAPFVTVNADIITDYPFSTLSLPKNRIAHLVLVPQPAYYAHADFDLTTDGLLSLDEPQWTFSGIACYHPQLLHHLKPGRFSITPIIKQQSRLQQVSAELYHGEWIDIGTPERLKRANLHFQSSIL